MKAVAKVRAIPPAKAAGTVTGGNVFTDLGFPENEARFLLMRADLMAQLRLWMQRQNLTQAQAQAAERLQVSAPRISDLVQVKWKKFSIDMLLTMAVRAGLKPTLKITD